MSVRRELKRIEPAVQPLEDEGMEMLEADIERFLEAWQAKGRTAQSRTKYRRALEMLYQYLPEDKRIRHGTLATWRKELLDNGYSASTINAFLAAGDKFVAFMGHREYQIEDRLAPDGNLQPELSRSEYQRLLMTAKALDDERLYLLVKTFACMGIHVQELQYLTIENIHAGRFQVTYQGAKRTVRVPDCLKRELLSYGERQGILSGTVFNNGDRAPLHRTRVTTLISNLCDAAKVSPEKGNPRCLRKLYLTTKANIELGMELLVEQAMDRQLEQEQLTFGWRA